MILQYIFTISIDFQVLPYDQLMQELDVTNVRELEDFLINECMYAVRIIPLRKSIYWSNVRKLIECICTWLLLLLSSMLSIACYNETVEWLAVARYSGQNDHYSWPQTAMAAKCLIE